MNVFNIFDDYEKKYHNWLNDKNVKSWYHPNQITGSFQGSKLESGLLSTRDNLWGQKPRDIPGQPPIHQLSGTQGWLGTSGQTPNLEGFKRGKLVSNLKQAGGTISEQTLGSPIGYGEGKVDPKLAEAQRASQSDIENMLTPKNKIGGGWKRSTIHKYNDIAEKYFSKYAIRNKKGEIVKSNGMVQLNDEGKAEYNKATSEFKNEMPANLDQTGNMGAGVTEDDAKGLAKFAGVSMDEMKESWKKKGGMDGLMANPAFTLGLALMQSSAQGKSIGSGAMDNFIKAAGISEHYKDRLKDRRNILGPVSDEQRGMVTSALPVDIMEPGILEGLGGDVARGHNAALNMVYENIYEKMANSGDWDYSAGTKQIKQSDIVKEFNKLKGNGTITVHQKIGSGSYLSTKDHKPDSKEFQGKTADTIENFGNWMKKKWKDIMMEPQPRAEGGPVNAGQPYLVGEKGPEVVVPNQNATVLSNDDSQVMSMLLSSNPQLQNISRARAEGILRSRFPDYFG
jgi:hypothetical protein